MGMNKSTIYQKAKGYDSAFTIVELLVVIVVIGILASLVVASFAGVSQKASVATLESDLRNAATQLEIDKTNSADGTYPISAAAASGGLGLPKSDGTTYDYKTSPDYTAYMLAASGSGLTNAAYISSLGGTVQPGDPYALPSGLLTNLVSYWSLDEASGVRYDAHGSNNLTDNNTVTSVTGKIGNAGVFVKANNETLSIVDGSQIGLDLTTFTFNFWVNVTDNSQYMSFFAKWNHAVNNQYRFEYTGSNLELYTASTCGSYNYTGSSHPWVPVEGRWYMLTIDYSGTTAHTYIDGVLVKTATLNRAIQNCAATFMIGGQQSSSSWAADALIDEFGVWSRVLNQTEITSLHNNGFGVQY
jgi:prepilin-type N-terminal cleavage/methylation domain-containing protein